MNPLQAWLFEGTDAPDDPRVAELKRDLDAIDAAARALGPLAPPALPVLALVGEDRVADGLRGDLAAIDAAAAALGEARGSGGGEDAAVGPAVRTPAGLRLATAVTAEIDAVTRAEVGVVAATARTVLLPGVPEAVSRAALARVFADEVAAGLGHDRRAIEAAARALPPLEAPVDLIEAVEAAVRADPRPVVAWRAPRPANRVAEGWGRRAWGGVLLGLAAAVALVVVAAKGARPDGTVPEGDPNDWTVRGNSGPRPTVDLRLSVRGPDGAIARLRRGENYPAGDVLLFRLDVDREAPVTLLRVDATQVAPVWSAEAASGPTDVRQGGEALGWALEAGESASVFVAVAGRGVSAEQLRERLPPGDDPAGVCAAVEALGFGCAAVRVEEVR